ncbi:MAG TPA: NAD(P)/FAD-dependent oxidoreductase [Verrucomicrobiales bacterium]|nr:NAD(P)/FAD-dependent oxidoreductase [Verrucomicrobiales bacterium]
MNTAAPASAPIPSEHDVIIIGGGISGAACGLLLKRALPGLRVLIVERTREFSRKVGESTSEVGACFLTRVLHLGAHLSSRHYQKHGLRMWFCRTPHDRVEDCTEIGPGFQSRLPTFQIDRGILDQHVLDEAERAGCALLRPATLRGIQLADDEKMHTVRVTTAPGVETEHSCRWLVDASGKAALLAKQLGLHRPLGDEHPTSSLWCRFRNVNDLDSARSRMAHPDLMKRVKGLRATATNHLTGRGWWVWLIPLSNGDYSAGIVWDRSIFTLPPGPSLTQRLKDHLLTHPIGRLMFAEAEAVEDDTFYYKGLPYHTEQMVGHRWAMVGDAAGFIDPLYSQGLDYCGHTVCAVTDLIRREVQGEDVSASVEYLKGAYKRSYRLWFESLYKGKYEYLGDAELMRIAFIMDLATYFIGPVRLVYDSPDYEWTRLPYDGPAGTFFAKFMSLYNRRLNKLAKTRLAKGTYGAWNNGMDFTLKVSFSPNFSTLRFLRWGIRLWLMAELRTLFGKAPSCAEPAAMPAPAASPAA